MTTVSLVDQQAYTAALSQACAVGDLLHLQDLIHRGTDDRPEPERLHWDRWHLLQAACQHGHLPILEYLILLVRADRYLLDELLVLVCEHGHPPAVSYLLSIGADPARRGYRALHEACRADQVGVVRVLVEHGVPRQVLVAAYHQACRSGNHRSARYLFRMVPWEASELEPCFLSACQGGHVEIVRSLSKEVQPRVLEAGYRVACDYWCPEVIHLLQGDIPGVVRREEAQRFMEVFRRRYPAGVEDPSTIDQITSGGDVQTAGCLVLHGGWVEAQICHWFGEVCRRSDLPTLLQICRLTATIFVRYPAFLVDAVLAHWSNEETLPQVIRRCGRLISFEVVADILRERYPERARNLVCHRNPILGWIQDGLVDDARYCLRTGYGVPLEGFMDAMCIASEQGDVESVQILVEMGVGGIHQVGGAFQRACEAGQVEVVRYLWERQNLDDGATSSWWKSRLVEGCCTRGDLPMVRYLLQIFEPDLQALEWFWMEACKAGHLSIAEHLISLGVDYLCQDGVALKAACRRGQLSIVRYLYGLGIGDRDHLKAYVKACGSAQIAVLQYLDDLGRSIWDSDLVEYTVSRRSHLDVLHYLEGRVFQDVPSRDRGFGYACASCRPEILLYLLDRGVSERGIEEGRRLYIQGVRDRLAPPGSDRRWREVRCLVILQLDPVECGLVWRDLIRLACGHVDEPSIRYLFSINPCLEEIARAKVHYPKCAVILQWIVQGRVKGARPTDC